MTRRLTRRQTIRGAASALAIAGGAGAGRAAQEVPDDADADVDVDRDATYPRRVYTPTADGEWEVAAPINVHALAPGKTAAGSAVEDAFTGLSNVRWTRSFPDSTTAAWDREERALVSPDHSFRRPRLGDEWEHVHVWDVDEDRAAIHAHLDVLDLTSSHFHRGDRYGEAAGAVTAQLLDHGWAIDDSYSIDYGVDDALRERWGATGDARVELSPSA